MTRFTAIDLTGLTPPGVVETIVYEEILQDLKDDCVQRMVDAGVEYDVQMLESDPVVKILEVAAYREMLLRARVNDAARAVMLAFSQQADLEHLGVYYGVIRQIVTPATDLVSAVYEADGRLRTRVQLAPEALSTAGPEGAYVFHAMTIDPLVKSVRAYQPYPGAVHVLPLTSVGNGIPSEILLSKIRQRLNEEDIRPLTDMVTVRAPGVLSYAISVQLTIADGPDQVVVRSAATSAIQAYLSSRHIVGVPIMTSGIIAAAHVPGVESVTLTYPTADVVPLDDQVATHSSITVTAV
jgi:phage-related baseplate assembly protein